MDGSLAMFAPVAARRQKEIKRGILSSFCPFRSFRTSEKNTIRKVSSCFFAGRRGAAPCLGDANTHAPHMCQFPYKIKPKYSQQTKQKIKVPSAFSFDEEGAKEKATKRKRRKKISRSAECLPSLGDADTHAPHMCQFPYKLKPKYSQQTKEKIKVPSAFSFDEEGAKEKATKRKRRKKISRSAECLPSLGDADTHAPRMCQFPPLSVDDTAFPKRRAKTLIAAARKLYFGAAKIKLKHKAF